MNGKYILDANGAPVVCHDLMKWGKWMEANPDARIVGKNQIGDVKVSTVFIGLDLSFGGGGPLVFETMIFGGEHDGYQERFVTREEALNGHQKALDVVAGKSDGR